MGFFSWFLCTILVVALVLLLFPFSVRIHFEAGERGARALFFFFKKKVYEYEKKWGKEEVGCRKSEVGSEENVKASTKDDSDGGVILEPKAIESTKTDLAEVAKPATSCHPETQEIEAKAPAAPKEELKATPAESKIDDAKKDSPKVVASKPIEVKSSESAKPESGKKEKPKKDKPKKEKQKLTDREFWTIVLTPDLDARAFKYALKIVAAVFSLFRIRFSDCFVEGIRSDYVTMGYIAAVNGVLKAYPYVGSWDLRMDWCHEKELRAAGNVRLSITLLRIFCFVLETLVLAGILAFIFWRRRAHVLKTKELPEIDFIRKKIVDFILED